jgi:hypothetical protein
VDELDVRPTPHKSPNMWQIVGIAALLLTLLLLVSFLYMRRSRDGLFRRVAAFTPPETAHASERMAKYLTEHHPAVDHSDMDALIPILEDMLIKPFGYMKIDPTDNDASVFSVGSFVGCWVVSHFEGAWADSADAGPSIIVGQTDRSVTLYPIQKAAMIREFRQQGELAVYLSSLRVIAQAIHTPAS